MDIVRRVQEKKINWSNFHYMVFDLPKQPGDFEERYSMLQHVVPKNHPFVSVAPGIRCQHIEHLQEFTRNIIDSGGEGVILRKPHTLYKGGRSDTFLKFKVECYC